MLAAAGADCVVTDVGSTKRALVAAHADARFVGGHPLAGAETAGVEHARADLFEGATWYLTPTPATSGVLYERLYRTLAGSARVRRRSTPRRTTGSWPASRTCRTCSPTCWRPRSRRASRRGESLPATGPSFRDATRVAGSNTAIWTDIYLSNRDAIVEGIDALTERLAAVREALARGDADAVAAWNDSAADDRRRLLEADAAGGPVHELRVAVPNEPGVVAKIALALGRAGVNIVDMALYPAADMSRGVIALWVAGDAAAARAEELIAELGLPVARA